jgi:hypothetical protein
VVGIADALDEEKQGRITMDNHPMNKALLPHKGESIHVVMVGQSVAISGKLIDVYCQTFVMSTRQSSKQVFASSHLVSFWCEEDKPTEDIPTEN